MTELELHSVHRGRAGPARRARGARAFAASDLQVSGWIPGRAAESVEPECFAESDWPARPRRPAFTGKSLIWLRAAGQKPDSESDSGCPRPGPAGARACQ
jgi:hypothetical protein